MAITVPIQLTNLKHLGDTGTLDQILDQIIVVNRVFTKSGVGIENTRRILVGFFPTWPKALRIIYNRQENRRKHLSQRMELRWFLGWEDKAPEINKPEDWKPADLLDRYPDAQTRARRYRERASVSEQEKKEQLAALIKKGNVSPFAISMLMAERERVRKAVADKRENEEREYKEASAGLLESIHERKGRALREIKSAIPNAGILMQVQAVLKGSAKPWSRQEEHFQKQLEKHIGWFDHDEVNELIEKKFGGKMAMGIILNVIDDTPEKRAELWEEAQERRLANKEKQPHIEIFHHEGTEEWQESMMIAKTLGIDEEEHRELLQAARAKRRERTRSEGGVEREHFRTVARRGKAYREMRDQMDINDLFGFDVWNGQVPDIEDDDVVPIPDIA